MVANAFRPAPFAALATDVPNVAAGIAAARHLGIQRGVTAVAALFVSAVHVLLHSNSIGTNP